MQKLRGKLSASWQKFGEGGTHPPPPRLPKFVITDFR